MSTQKAVQTQEVKRAFTPQVGSVLQHPVVNNTSNDGAPPIVLEVLNSVGQPLDMATRAFMEPRFGHDFSGVRVHTDADAAESARAVNALAYTVGQDLVFGGGQYTPQSNVGKRLIAHELTHVVQQQNRLGALQEKLRIGNPTDSTEGSADMMAHAVMLPENGLHSSTALRIRDQLRSSSQSYPIVQRQVRTWGGEFDTDKYELTKDPGMDGVEIELRFKPGANVNAELIGMTQSVLSTEKGRPFAKGIGKDKATLESRMIPASEAGAGTYIDQFTDYGNPLYPTDKPGAKDTLADTPTIARWGQHGWRYTDRAGKPKTQDALLKDRPQRFSRRKETRQVFETTALAVKGVQTGTYYGSVQWGWEKDAADTVTKLPLSLVSRGVPSASFNRAAKLWNQSKTSEGKETIDLPVVSVKTITGANAQLFATPDDAQAVMVPGTPLPVGTRFRILRDVQLIYMHPVIQIEIVDGPLTGQRGYILDTVNFQDE